MVKIFIPSLQSGDFTSTEVTNRCEYVVIGGGGGGGAGQPGSVGGGGGWCWWMAFGQITSSPIGTHSYRCWW